MKELNYYVLDVFSDERFKGNQLSVVCCDEDLQPGQYIDIAREFGFSETSFVNYSSPDKAFKVISFTEGGIEINGAGHNLLGAVCLALLKNWNIFREQTGDPYVIMRDEKIRLIIDQAGLENGGRKQASPFVGMMQRPATIVGAVPVDVIAAAVGLEPGALSLNQWEPSIVKTEVTHLMVPVKNGETLNKATINKVLLNKASEKFGFEGCYLFTTDHHKTGYLAESRFFNPKMGIDEDAATGSAAGPLAGYLYHHQYIHSGEDHMILQGEQMKRPSSIHIKVTQHGIQVSGSSIIVMEGVLYL